MSLSKERMWLAIKVWRSQERLFLALKVSWWKERLWLAEKCHDGKERLWLALKVPQSRDRLWLVLKVSRLKSLWHWFHAIDTPPNDISNRSTWDSTLASSRKNATMQKFGTCHDDLVCYICALYGIKHNNWPSYNRKKCAELLRK